MKCGVNKKNLFPSEYQTVSFRKCPERHCFFLLFLVFKRFFAALKMTRTGQKLSDSPSDKISILCHPERSEGSLESIDYEILRFAQNDTSVRVILTKGRIFFLLLTTRIEIFRFAPKWHGRDKKLSNSPLKTFFSLIKFYNHKFWFYNHKHWLYNQSHWLYNHNHWLYNQSHWL